MNPRALSFTAQAAARMLQYIEFAQEMLGEVEVGFVLVSPPDDVMTVYDIALLQDQAVSSCNFDVTEAGLAATLSTLRSTHPGAHASGFIHLHPSEQGDEMVFHSHVDEDGIRPLLERLAARRPTPTHWSRTLDAQRDEQGRLALSLDLHGRRTIVLEGHGEEAVSATLEGVDMIGLGHSIVCARTAPDAEEPLAFGSFSTRTRWLPTLSSDGTIRVLPEAEHLEFEVQIVDAETQGLPTPPHRTRAQIEAEVLQHVTPLQPVYLEPIYAPDAHEDAPIDDPTTAPTARVSPFARATVRQMALIALQALQALVALIDEDEQAS